MYGLPRALLAASALCVASVLVLASYAAHAGNDQGPPTVVSGW
ncbi:hypothetical protein DB30_02181 [Enhygromyxa salina]|uniref:Uncharacterized protein n=1 Tax=Enhygromyxa salina TaxID=215803 RepID=A0A0C2D429_9BACT|nr:hypothetical protein DB30_02181 [Enhygromyxa salina]